MRLALPAIRHDYEGLAALTRLYAQTKGCFLDEVEIDMEATNWFDADMCAAFGAILYSLGRNLNTVNLINIAPNVGDVLSKNGFLSHYGRVKIPDSWGTTISYQRFDVTDDRFFSDYIEREFIHRAEMPEMSPALLKKFRRNLFEVFSNAVLHSRTEMGIFSCGQFFPKRNQLDFTVADLGVGIRQNVRDHTGLDFSAEEAIVWATKGKNTTRRGPVPGGLGLKLLSEFIDLNCGCLQIVSDDGYWRRDKGRISTGQLWYPFPGTLVHVEINTADSHSYSLASELDAEDLF